MLDTGGNGCQVSSECGRSARSMLKLPSCKFWIQLEGPCRRRGSDTRARASLELTQRTARVGGPATRHRVSPTEPRRSSRRKTRASPRRGRKAVAPRGARVTRKSSAKRAMHDATITLTFWPSAVKIDEAAPSSTNVSARVHTRRFTLTELRSLDYRTAGSGAGPVSYGSSNSTPTV